MKHNVKNHIANERSVRGFSSLLSVHVFYRRFFYPLSCILLMRALQINFKFIRFSASQLTQVSDTILNDLRASIHIIYFAFVHFWFLKMI